MDLAFTTYLVVGFTFAIYIGIAIWARAGSTKEFYIAGGGIHPIANGMATAADWMSAASFIGMAGLIAFMGYGGSVFLMGWTGGYVILAMLLAPYLRKYGKFTVPEFIGDRFYSDAARIVAVICLILGTFVEIVPVFYLTVPIFAALALSLGLDILQLYIVFVAFAGIGMITPPVCVGIYTAAGVAKESPEKAFREVPVFVGVGIIFGMLMIAFPQAATWLPNLLN
mgnify:CR=1 FL=1